MTLEGPETGSRLPLPPQFFYGVSDWDNFRPLDEVAVEVSAPIEAYSVTIDEVPPQPPLPPLAEKSVVAIFDFLDYPNKYEDPLREVKVWDGNWSDIHGEKAGAARYIAHRGQKYTVNKILYDRDRRAEEPNNATRRSDDDVER